MHETRQKMHYAHTNLLLDPLVVFTQIRTLQFPIWNYQIREFGIPEEVASLRWWSLRGSSQGENKPCPLQTALTQAPSMEGLPCLDTSWHQLTPADTG